METGMTAIDIIRENIRKSDSCEARHVQSVPIREEHEGKVVWDGVVEVFELDDPDATTAYGWRHENDDGRMVTNVVIGVEPINRPRDAVRAAVVAEMRLTMAPGRH